MYFGLLQRFECLLPTSRHPAVPFHSAAPRLALSNPKDLCFSSREPEKGAGWGSYSWLVRWPWVSAVLSPGECALNCTGGKHSRTGNVSRTCLLFVSESNGNVARAWFPMGLSWHPEGLGSNQGPGPGWILNDSPGEAGRAVTLADPGR